MKIAGHEAVRHEFTEGEVTVSLWRVASLEEIADREALLSAEAVPEPPYWAHLWIGAVALARRVARGPSLAGVRALDLGCGLGLPGLAAAARGAEVWFVDREPAAIEFVRASVALAGLERCHPLVADFTWAPPELEALRFDLILGAEVVYDPAAYEPLALFLESQLAPSGTLLLTDAFRADASRFFARLEGRGFTGERHPHREWEDGRPQGLFIWELHR